MLLGQKTKLSALETSQTSVPLSMETYPYRDPSQDYLNGLRQFMVAGNGCAVGVHMRESLVFLSNSPDKIYKEFNQVAKRCVLLEPMTILVWNTTQTITGAPRPINHELKSLLCRTAVTLIKAQKVDGALNEYEKQKLDQLVMGHDERGRSLDDFCQDLVGVDDLTITQ